MRAWALLTVSSEQQADTLAHQRAWAEEAAKAMGWELVLVRGDDHEGVGSGKDGPRRIVQQVIGELRALPAEARPDWLMVTRADRLGRGGDIVDNQLVLRDLKRLGVRVWARLGGEKKTDTAMEQFFNAAEAALAAQENEVRRDKMVAVYKRKRDAGQVVGNKRPYGLVLGPNSLDIVDDERAPIVREIFRMRVSGAGALAIARHVAPSAPPYALRTGKLKPVHWDAKRVKWILGNKTYVPLVIDEVTFARAQAIGAQMARESPTHKEPKIRRPLVGAIRCYCGQSMWGRATGGRGPNSRKHAYYACLAIWAHDKIRLVRAADVEAQFIAMLQRMTASKTLMESYLRRAYSGPSPKLLERSIAEVRAKIAGIGKARDRVWAMHERGDLRDADVQERLDAVTAERDELAEQLTILNTDLAVALAATSKDQDRTDVEAVFRETAARWNEWSFESQKGAARAISIHLGGLCVEADGTLTRRLVSPRAQKREQA